MGKNWNSFTRNLFSMNPQNFIRRIAWLIVVGAALYISWWSLDFLGNNILHFTPSVSAVLSIAIDAGAIVAANQAMDWAKIPGASGFSARLSMLTMVGLSAFLNYEHGALDPSAPYLARWVLPIPPIIALVTMENHFRYLNKAPLKRAGKLAASLPHYAKWAWFFRPVKVIKAILWHVDRQIAASMNEENTYTVTMTNGEVPNHKLIRLWAVQEGMTDVPERGPLPGRIIKEYMARALPSAENSENGDTEGVA